jgi:hypothetical protein
MKTSCKKKRSVIASGKMILFSIASLPFFYLLVLSLSGESARSSAAGRPFLLGAVLFIPVFVVHLLIRTFVREGFSAAGIYFYYLLFDNLLPVLLASGCFAVAAVRKSRAPAQFLQLFGFAAGFFTLFAAVEWVLAMRKPGWYELFLLPSGRMVLTAGVPVLAAAGLSSSGVRRALLLAGIPVLTALTAFVSFFAQLNHPVIATAALLVPAGAVLASYLFLRREL